jgi:sterol desaturase/sphingolipid hydroxylase (fatty acid hydroxylase superfamily)
MEILHYMQAHFPPVVLSMIRLFVWLLLLSLIFVPIERLWALRKQKISRKALITDVVYYFLNSLLPNIILAIPVSLIAWGVHRLMPWHIQTMFAGLPVWAHIALAFIVVQIGVYWGHRWSHEIPFLWRFHAIHHSAEEMDWLINMRAHPFDMVFTRLCGFVLLYIFGLAQPTGGPEDLAPILIILFGTVWGFFIHANLRWRFGPLEWVIATPAFHHWHHTRSDNTDRNYAATLPVLDWLFGTYYMPKMAWPTQYGTDTFVSTNFSAQLLDPILGAKQPTMRQNPPLKA